MKGVVDKAEQFGKFSLFNELGNEGTTSTLAWPKHTVGQPSVKMATSVIAHRPI